LIDTVPVLQHLLSHPLEGRQVGLIAAGSQEVSFSDFAVWSGRPRAFVVMQFAEPYDTFYDEVIRKQADAAGFEVVRIDEKAGPGVIFQDIQHEIEQAEIVIAEITPANPNVFTSWVMLTLLENRQSCWLRGDHSYLSTSAVLGWSSTTTRSAAKPRSSEI